MRVLVHVKIRWTPRRPGLPDEQDVELAQDGPPSVRDLLEQIEEPLEGVLAVRNDQPIPLDTPLVDGEELLLVRTVSGG